MNSTALEALHVAAAAIEGMRNVSECTADNDNDSGEVVFTVKGGKTYVLKLEEYEC